MYDHGACHILDDLVMYEQNQSQIQHLELFSQRMIGIDAFMDF